MSTKYPSCIAIFPLYGTILLPNTILPLRIFETRYLAMMEDVLSQAPYVGIIQPMHEYGDHLYSIGCLGEISVHQKLNKGEYLIRLNGVQRFRVEQELEVNTLYRQALVDYEVFQQDLTLENTKFPAESLYKPLERYLMKYNLSLAWDKIQTIPLHYLINLLCMNMEFSSEEKQAFLEAPTLTSRWEMLIASLEMEIELYSSMNRKALN
ncbi:LON peptidase substrate-binding domain-containing protein [Deltaproteobacteria bacterium TL4]